MNQEWFGSSGLQQVCKKGQELRSSALFTLNCRGSIREYQVFACTAMRGTSIHFHPQEKPQCPCLPDGLVD